jgi:colanic acid/amylovoran biosynthesis glycosyltransferase
MRIAFVLVAFPSLSETFILNQMTGFLDQGHQIDVYSEKSGEEIMHPDVNKYDLLSNVHSCPWIPRNCFKRVIKGLWLFLRHFHCNPVVLWRCLSLKNQGNQDEFFKMIYEAIPFIGKKEYDVILCHFGENGKKMIKLRDVGAVSGKIVTVFHGADITRYLLKKENDVYTELFEKGDLFLPISEHWKRKLIELGCQEGKIKVHHMGINCDKFFYHHREMGPEKRVQIVSIARLVEKKGIEYAILAINSLQLPDGFGIVYTIIGDGPRMDAISNLIEKSDDLKKVKLLGWRQQSEVINILNEAHIFLAPSVTASDGDQEGIPVSIMEAMAVGLPLISTYHSGIPELVDNEKTGFLVAEKDVSALAEKIDYLIRNSESWSLIGRAARNRVEAMFNIHTLNATLIKTCQEISLGR